MALGPGAWRPSLPHPQPPRWFGTRVRRARCWRLRGSPSLFPLPSRSPLCSTTLSHAAAFPGLPGSLSAVLGPAVPLHPRPPLIFRAARAQGDRFSPTSPRFVEARGLAPHLCAPLVRTQRGWRRGGLLRGPCAPVLAQARSRLKNRGRGMWLGVRLARRRLAPRRPPGRTEWRENSRLWSRLGVLSVGEIGFDPPGAG